MKNNRPLVGVSVIVKKGNKVLIGKRKNILGHGEWGFPGGHLEFKESLEECVKREVREEAGIKIKNIKFQAATNDIRPGIETHYVTLFFTCGYKSGKVKNMEPEKCEGWKWVSWNKLPRPLFLPIKNFLKQKFRP
ncbi:MAG: DNA mismatch repair protein MutT [Candidatus Levybacteria bacterium RIFCSPLOWO2_01_FULL_38_13]|nr:MAG: DNA mismatch repair protein MutT [Candidatus Levybacteria bacterium RIFCSPHIGHO2_01_FULL_41_15]OGH35218.1 MAG: DNA mismatch repair protein MutT [Candidatus Levybacteria bacterium RIFCSPLOWO2_01_FULL_38_13]